jgi:predicted metal-binding membrane protein
MAILFLAVLAVLWVGALALASAHSHAGGAPAQAHAGVHAHGGAAAGAPSLVALFATWTAMMVAMMVPPELRMVVVQLRSRAGWTSVARGAAFLAGLFAVWAAFSAAAAFAHWELERRHLTDASGLLASPAAGAALLGIIGAFQLTPLKGICLERCRASEAPLRTRPGPRGAVAAGLRHGTISLGSCSLLMLVPFGLGGMGLAPMAAITALLVVEKLGRAGLWVGRAAGAALVAWSFVVLAVRG